MYNSFNNLGQGANKQINHSKRALKALSYNIPDDNKLANAIEAFQNDYGLKVDGYLDDKTWNVLENAYERKTGYKLVEDDNDFKEEAIEEVSYEEEEEDNYFEEDGEILEENEPVEDEDIFEQELGFIEEEPTEENDFFDNKNFEDDVIVPEPASAQFIFKKSPKYIVKKDCKGDYVLELQKGLNILNFLDSYTPSVFDVKTETALKNFQKEHCIRVTGVAYANTWAIMFFEIHKKTQKELKPILKTGSTGQYVYELQIKLTILKYYDGEIDGIFGSKTKEAVVEFQENMGLYVDGVCGEDTWTMLDNMFCAFTSTKIITINSIANEQHSENEQTTSNEEYNFQATSEGMTGESVFKLQENLIELDYLMGIPDGKFGQKTLNAVKSFQKNNSLTPDGVVGKLTWEAFEKSKGITPESKTFSITSLQQELIRHQYYDGEINGKMDFTTTTALKAFQEANDLYPSGIIEDKTWEVIIK